MKKFLTIALFAIKNIFLFMGCVVLATLFGFLIFLPAAILFHLNPVWFIGIITFCFIAWIAWSTAVDEYKMKHGHKG